MPQTVQQWYAADQVLPRRHRYQRWKKAKRGLCNRSKYGCHLRSERLASADITKGIHGDIQDAYHFLCLNYEPEDEIYLVGFSRGAFAARTLACFVNDFGILRATRLVALTMVYDWWKDSNKKQLNECAGRWADEGHLLINVPIKTCAVWDTVRSLFTDSNTGFPCWEQSKTLEFVEDQIPNRLNYAFQALALHETRKHFKPVLWNSDSNECTVIRETWFAGDHCDIGGGHEDCGLATIALLWMIAQFKEFTDVAFHEEMVLEYMTPMYFVSGDNTEYFLLTAFYTSGKLQLILLHYFSPKTRCGTREIVVEGDAVVYRQ